MNYTIISADKKIVRHLRCSADLLAMQLASGETAIAGHYPETEYDIGSNGEPVAVGPAVRRARRREMEKRKGPNQTQIIRAIVKDLRAANIPLNNLSQLLNRNL